MSARRMVVHGRVQGVGFRFFVSQLGRDLGLSGRVRNLADGSVEIITAGDDDTLEAFRARVRVGPAGARVEYLEEAPVEDTELPPQFRIER